MTTDAATLIASLARHRRRWWLTRAFPTVCVAIVIVASAAAAGAPLPWMTAFAVPLAAIVVATRVPTVSQTAGELDRRARLDDRLTTALQFADRDDAFSLLVVRDAAARIRSLHPANAFPFELPRAAKTAMAIAVAVTGLLALRGQGSFLDRDTQADAVAFGSAAGVAPNAGTAVSRPGSPAAPVTVPRASVELGTARESPQPPSAKQVERNATGTSGANDNRGAGQATAGRSADTGAGGVNGAANGTSQAARDVPVDLRAYVRRYFAAINKRTGQ